MFNGWNPEHIWRELPDKEFLEMLGGYRRNRRDNVEGLTVAGLLMFGTGLAIRDRFDNILMDYRDETGAAGETRWVDRVTYDGTWENNLFNFFRKVTPKLTENLAVPFVLENQQRVNDTPVHKAVREAFVNMIIHSDYRMDAGVLKVIKFDNGFSFSNPGNLKLPKEQIYRGGDSKARNPHMQTMLRMVGFGDNAGSGFPEILKVWSDNGWEEPDLFEDTILNQVTLTLKESAEKSAESAEKSAESAEKSVESLPQNDDRLSDRHKQILSFMDEGTEYSTDEVADRIGLKGPRTRQLLNELVDIGKLTSTATTKNRRYIKKVRK
jgi:predicted HTH transcriptional regulator